MYQAYIVYFVLLFLLLLLAIKHGFGLSNETLRDKNNYFIISNISIVLFSLIIGLRFYVGGDYPGYFDDFNFFVKFEIPFTDSRYGLGYYGLMSFLKLLGLSYPFLFISIAFLQILFIYRWASLNKFLLPWVIFFYFTSLYLFESMNIMRQAIAFSIILFSIKYIYKSEKLKFLIALLLASSFHRSAIAFAPFYFFLEINWIRNKYIQMALLISAFSSVKFIFIEFFNQVSVIALALDYESYSKITPDLFLEVDTSGFGLGLYFILIIDLIIIYYSDKLKKVFREYNFISYYNMFLIGALFTPVTSTTNSIVLYRFMFYFSSFRFIILSFLCYYLFSINKSTRNKFFGYLITVSFLFWFIIAINKGAAWSSPFQFIFQDFSPNR